MLNKILTISSVLLLGFCVGAIAHDMWAVTVPKNKSVKEVIGLYLDKEIGDNKRYYDQFKEACDERMDTKPTKSYQETERGKYEYHLKGLLELKDKVKQL